MDDSKQLRKLVKSIGNSGHITLPKKWVGNFVKVNLDNVCEDKETCKEHEEERCSGEKNGGSIE